jgi:hypothetical protein
MKKPEDSTKVIKSMRLQRQGRFQNVLFSTLKHESPKENTMTLKHNNLVGLILIGVGALAIIGNIGIFGDISTLLFALGFGAAGVYLIRTFFKDHKQIWASIVGFTLVGLALESITAGLAGFYFLGMIGMGFAMIYRLDSKHWWAVIPAGVLLTLATVAGSEVVFRGWDAGPLFFAGLAATFGYLYLSVRKHWAVYPALALLIISLLGITVTGGWIFPMLLIGAGIYALNRKRQPTFQTTTVAPNYPVPVVTADVPVPNPNVSQKPVTEIQFHEIDLAPVASARTIAELEDRIKAIDEVTSESDSSTQTKPDDETKA